MSDPTANIRAAFTARLQTLPSLPSVAWENIPFTPVDGTPYLEPWLLPGEPNQAETGTAGANRHNGIYQISVVYPAGQGIGAATALASSICDHFKRGTIVSYGGVSATCQKAYQSKPMIETDRIDIPVTVQYRADVPN